MGVAEASERGVDRLPEEAHRQVDGSQHKARADTEGVDDPDGSDKGILASLRV